ncbi:sensor histidine kinase [Marmoricola sp. URHA0025 HA25]
MAQDRAVTDGDPHRATRKPSGLARWVVVSRGPTEELPAVRRPARLLVLVAAGAVAVLVLSALVGVLAARKLAERQAVNDAANTADLLAEAVVQPILTDAVPTGDPAAIAALGTALEQYVSASTLVRIKIWTRDGRIIYSDEPRLVGEQFDLGAEEREVFSHPRTVAEVSDLQKPENRFERGRGRLLEAYRPVWTPSGTPLLFETYSPYTEVDRRSTQLWRGFAGVTISSLLLFAALLTPLVWQLLTRLRAAQGQRERLLERAVTASEEERRRIAGTLHDGVVQELAATSFAVAAAASRAQASGDPDLAEDLDAAALTLRNSIGGLRTLLVDIYPATLQGAGILDVLRDLAGTLRSRDIELDLSLPESDPGLGTAGDRLLFRITHEALENVRRHASARHVSLHLQSTPESVVLEIADDGVGFDPEEALARPPEGHFGLRVLADVASEEGAELAVSSAPGAGCRWRLTVPRR